MRILGIDPGNVRAGYGVIKKEGAKMTHLESGLLEVPRLADPGTQLVSLEKELRSLLLRSEPDLVGLEKIFVSKNKKTGVFVAQARGLILKEVTSFGIKLVELSPSSVKLSVAGNGRADKEAVAKMVGFFLNIKTAGLLDDVTDALAIAIAASSGARITESRSSAAD